MVPGDAWDQKLKAAQAAGTAPDVYIQAGRLDTAARTGTLLALDDLFEADVLASVTDIAKEVSQYQGQFYAFPLLVEPQMMLYWNRQPVLNRLAWTRTRPRPPGTRCTTPARLWPE